MSRAVVSFSKNGYARYTSHLDMLRILKRAFRCAGIDVQYSQGFNPHPKMSFAQPLSLGYAADCELLEFETEGTYDDGIREAVRPFLPEGIEITGYGVLEGKQKLAAAVTAAEYEIVIPARIGPERMEALVSSYLEQNEISVRKFQKKSHKETTVDIRGKICALEPFVTQNGDAGLHLICDAGSQSNLSPELVVTSFLDHAGLKIPRYKIEIRRKKLILPVDITIKWK